MKKKVLIGVAIILIIILLIFATLFIIDNIKMNNNEEVIFSTWGRDYTVSKTEENTSKSENNIKDQENNDINFSLTMDDEIQNNTAWCGTFQLIWNDLKNDLAKQDIVFIDDPNLQVVENLNKEEFKEEHLSEESYYKTYGHPSIEFKKQIEEAIKEKLNETSDILDDFNW